MTRSDKRHLWRSYSDSPRNYRIPSLSVSLRRLSPNFRNETVSAMSLVSADRYFFRSQYFLSVSGLRNSYRQLSLPRPPCFSFTARRGKGPVNTAVGRSSEVCSVRRVGDNLLRWRTAPSPKCEATHPQIPPKTISLRKLLVLPFPPTIPILDIQMTVRARYKHVEPIKSWLEYRT